MGDRLGSPSGAVDFSYFRRVDALHFSCRHRKGLTQGHHNVAGIICNLPGWRWATITKVALDRLSRSLHSDVCDSDGLRDAAIHSTISGSGGRRDRATSNIIEIYVSPSWLSCAVAVVTRVVVLLAVVNILHETTERVVLPVGEQHCSYLLGLLAMIKCSICSYQCEN